MGIAQVEELKAVLLAVKEKTRSRIIENSRWEGLRDPEIHSAQIQEYQSAYCKEIGHRKKNCPRLWIPNSDSWGIRIPL